MISPTDDARITTLRALGNRIKEEVERGIQSQSLMAEHVQYWEKRITHIDVTADGLLANWQGEEGVLTRDDWGSAVIAIEKEITTTPEYIAAQEMEKTTNVGHFGQALRWFVIHLARQGFEHGSIPFSTVDALCATVLKEINEHPIPYRTTAFLYDLAIPPDPIALSHQQVAVTLRRTKCDDLRQERPVLYDFGVIEKDWRMPAVVLEVEANCVKPAELDRHIRQLLVILRLFRAVGITSGSYTPQSDSILYWMETHGMRWQGYKPEVSAKSVITPDDVPVLRRYWDALIGQMPPSLIPGSDAKSDSLSIAYERYSDALTKNGLFSRRVANASMGLESLLLNAKDLIGYRLGLRAAKLLGYLGYKSLDVKQAIEDAYTYRSAFAHGDQVGSKTVNKHNRHYGDHTKLLTYILNYLRVVLITFILVNMTKDDLIGMLDDALIDEAKAGELKARLSTVIGLINPFNAQAS